MKILVVFDDTGRKSDVIKDIIGDRGFSEVRVRKVSWADRVGGRMRRGRADVVVRGVVA